MLWSLERDTQGEHLTKILTFSLLCSQMILCYFKDIFVQAYTHVLAKI